MRQRLLHEAMNRNILLDKIRKLIPQARDQGLYIEAQALAQLTQYIETRDDDDSSFLMKLLRRSKVKEAE